MQMHIEVKKISVVTKRALDGSTVRNPLNKGAEVKTETKVVLETIRIDEIKSARSWHKSFDEEAAIEGDVTMVYLIGDKSKEPAQMKINESYDSFTGRLNVIKSNG
jgi:hypothetical protein